MVMLILQLMMMMMMLTMTKNRMSIRDTKEDHTTDVKVYTATLDLMVVLCFDEV